MSVRPVVGCMSGTSLDGLDAALVDITARGLAMTARLRRHVSRPLGSLADGLRALAAQQPRSAGEIARLVQEFELLHLDAVRTVCADTHPGLVAVHGQTVFHAPPVSWQLLSVSRLARELGAPVVYNLRAADLATGGQGAPITPLADYIFFQSETEARAVLNLGGFCNFTLLPRGPRGDDAGALAAIGGGDICACNQLLDALARELLGTPFDADGARALCGASRPRAHAALAARLRDQAAGGRSLGTGDELGEWIDAWRGQATPEDLLRTACNAIAAVACERIGPVERLIVAGGGAHNGAMLAALRSRGVPVSLSDEFGVPIQAREAAAMAVLGALCQDGVPITLPQITGCAVPAPRAGCWAYP